MRWKEGVVDALGEERTARETPRVLARAPYEILIKFHNLEATFALSHRIVPPRDLSFCRRNGTRCRFSALLITILLLSLPPPPSPLTPEYVDVALASSRRIAR